MKLTITPEAEQELKDIKTNDSSLVLWYDTDGCGCGVNGLPTIKLVTERQDYYEELTGNTTLATFIDSRQAVFFSNDMKLDIRNGVFRLSSPEGILNPFITTQQVIQR
ncbi:iron-sulfur cluster biosynthesis family protein [Oceanobacillus sp. FSL K6-2867]|uniref:iron-sulfur cluster biosynthesis family protein n=1 Tax=Oceanobacillus sp. FSL K6-2867 TaxID=2954748 RepID=UPI0030D88B95